jgi:hypothetical protein
LRVALGQECIGDRLLSPFYPLLDNWTRRRTWLSGGTLLDVGVLVAQGALADLNQAITGLARTVEFAAIET